MMYVITIFIGWLCYMFKGSHEVFGIFAFFTLVSFIISIVVQLVRYHCHAEVIEGIKELNADIDVYKRQCDDLLAEVKLYLIDKFPEHELKVFDKITKNTANFLAIDYPELKSDETFTNAVQTIVSYKSKQYELERRINRFEKDYNLRKKTMWLTGFPILPKRD